MNFPLRSTPPRSLAFLLGIFLLLSVTRSMASSHLLFLGTYTKTGTSKGIYAIRLDSDTGALGAPTLVAEATDPAWLTLTPDKKFLYTIHPSAAQAIGFAVDSATGKLTPLPRAEAASTPANAPSHLAVDATGRVLLTANYRDGAVSALPIRPDGSLGSPNTHKHEGRGPNPERQEKPHVHSVTLSPDNRFVIVADLGLDKVFSYALDAATAKLAPGPAPFVTVPPGAGPRHFKFSRDGKRGYVINEMGGSITAFDYDAPRGALTPIQTISTLPPNFTGLKWNAEIRVHPNGRFLYGSNRTHDSIAVFSIDPASGRLALIEIVPSGGKTPRNFELSPDGKWLVCGHQDQPLITVFRVDAATGKLARTPHTAAVDGCVCVHFAD
jgi:6-phosphogluconolactonase